MNQPLQRSARAVFALIALASLGAVAVALVSQHVFDMQPCPWCVLQRAIFVAIALAVLPGIVWPARPLLLASALLADLLATAGTAAALWQHFVAAASSSCKLTLADRIMSGLGLDALAPEVFAPRASCADAAVDLAGVPYEFWSLALYLLIGLGASLAVVKALRER
jgi:disulfide bond formation protein DsbB